MKTADIAARPIGQDQQARQHRKTEKERQNRRCRRRRSCRATPARAAKLNQQRGQTTPARRAKSSSACKIAGNQILCAALVDFMAAADEACVGIGLPTKPKTELSDSLFALQGWKTLHRYGTLTPEVATSIGSVLPKQHTPRSGLTLRSMSHHLALHTSSEVSAVWRLVPHVYGSQLNIVLAPWPLVIKPKQFNVANCKDVDMPPRFGCFDLELEKRKGPVVEWTRKLLAKAEDLCGRIDAVVFPEAALTHEQFRAVDQVTKAHNAVLMAGVLSKKAAGGPALNQAWIRAGLNSRFEQCKHHRWRVDPKQVGMYGLGGTLDPKREWWEHINVESREVRFLALNGDMVLCCLICEDLARQDPVAELVRTMGPNLVIALLADGPQIRQRWPSRYATVLADDPGCSVLTMTSLGMAQLARPPEGKSRSRSIALWKDAFSDVEEIVLPERSMGMVLNLRTRNKREWTADGRSDRGVASYPHLVGVHSIDWN